MARLHTDLDLPQPLSLRRAVDGDAPALRHLWLLFRHHLSKYDGTLPAADGAYRAERLERALDSCQRPWQAWVLRAAHHPVAFAVTRSLDQPVRVLSSLFVVAPARRGGLGLQFARAVVMASPPGTWSVAYQGANRPAAAFWPRVAASFGSDWDLQHRAVPDRPDLPPDAWVTFTIFRT